MAAKKSKKNVQPPWRPDFRQVDALPDIKIIRTDFLLNGIAVFSLLAVLLFGFFTEITIQAVSSERDALQNRIAANTAENRQAQNLDRQYQQVSRKLRQVNTFLDVYAQPSALLQAVTAVIPDGVVVESINLSRAIEGSRRSQQVFYVISIVGTVVETDAERDGSEVVIELRDTLAEVPLWVEDVADATLSSERDPTTRFWPFTINLRLAT